MVASDLAITKGNRNIVLELSALGIPSITISHGLNPIDDLRTSRINTNVTIQSRHIEALNLATIMNRMISDAATNVASSSSVVSDGVSKAAQRLSRQCDLLSNRNHH